MSVVWPYSYSWDTNPFPLTNAFNISQISNAIFSFVISDNEGKVASDLDYKLDDLISFQNLGGNLRISFGGASGMMIDEAIIDETMLYNEYDKIIIKTNCYNFDFDIEGNNVRKEDVNNRRNNVLLKLQESYPNLFISYTLSADTNGLSDDNLKIIRNSLNSGVNINMVNVMLMDNGWSDSATSSIQSIQTLQNQLKYIWPNKTLYDINKMIGACFMIGKNDDWSYFSLDNANTVVDYFNSIGGIGQISYWALQRDTVGFNDYSMHSLYNNNNFDFYNIFSRMKTNTTNENNKNNSSKDLNQQLGNQKIKNKDIIINGEKYTIAQDSNINFVINDKKYKIELDPNTNWVKVNNITMGESKKFEYKTINSNDIGNILNVLSDDENVKLLNYNWKTNTAYLKTGFDINISGDITLNEDNTVFIKN